MQTINSILPEEIWKSRISLENLGVKDTAWMFSEVIKVIDILKSNGYMILGGDVYKRVNDKIEATYDSWYINKSKVSVNEAMQKAESYIKVYHERNGDNYVYSVIVANK